MTAITSAILALLIAAFVFLAAVVWCGAALSKLMAEMDEGIPGGGYKGGELERPTEGRPDAALPGSRSPVKSGHLQQPIRS